MSAARAVRRLTRPTQRKADMMVGRAILRLVEDTAGIQMVQVDLLADETIDDLEHLQPYGYKSRAKPGADGLLLSVGGSRSNGVVILIGDRRYGLELEEGEAAIYDDLGQKVHLTRDGIVISTTLPVTVQSDERVTIEAPEVVVDSDEVSIAGGGPAIARVGDQVTVGGSTGTITSGSGKAVCG